MWVWVCECVCECGCVCVCEYVCVYRWMYVGVIIQDNPGAPQWAVRESRPFSTYSISSDMNFSPWCQTLLRYQTPKRNCRKNWRLAREKGAEKRKGHLYIWLCLQHNPTFPQLISWASIAAENQSCTLVLIIRHKEANSTFISSPANKPTMGGKWQHAVSLAFRANVRV